MKYQKKDDKNLLSLKGIWVQPMKHLTDGITDQTLCYVHVRAVDHQTERKQPTHLMKYNNEKT